MVYIPVGGIKMFASLRDESPLRQPSAPPEAFDGACSRYIMPVDPQGGGSWLGVNDNNVVVVLLNGGFEAHTPAPPYRMSRGIVVKRLLDGKMPVVDWMLMDMENVEPYTLIVYSEGLLFRLTWDGTRKYRQLLDVNACHIFSSATLYSQQAMQTRAHAFRNWMAMRPPIDKLSLLDFFNSIEDSHNGFIINRSEIVKTLSYSFISLAHDAPQFHYYDLRKYKYYHTSFGTNA